MSQVRNAKREMLKLSNTAFCVRVTSKDMSPCRMWHGRLMYHIIVLKPRSRLQKEPMPCRPMPLFAQLWGQRADGVRLTMPDSRKRNSRSEDPQGDKFKKPGASPCLGQPRKIRIGSGRTLRCPDCLCGLVNIFSSSLFSRRPLTTNIEIWSLLVAILQVRIIRLAGNW